MQSVVVYSLNHDLTAPLLLNRTLSLVLNRTLNLPKTSPCIDISVMGALISPSTAYNAAETLNIYI